jgi:prohibitin 2
MFIFGSYFIVGPGERGIVVTLGKVSKSVSTEGLNFKVPLISSVVKVSVRQQTESLEAASFSADLQQINVTLKVLYKIPESGVIQIYQQFAGSPFDSLIAPRIQEALKEATALESAEGIVKKREILKMKTLDAAKKKIGDMLIIEDIVIENVTLSKELEAAIEAKMVQEQEAAKANFTKQKAMIDAQTVAIKAEGEAQAIRKRGDAIRANPGVIELMIAEKWDGVSPLVVGSTSGANIMLPINTKAKQE